MLKEGIFSLEAPYKSEADLYKSLLKCYNLICSKNITDKEIEFLSIYLRYGYSKETRKLVREQFDISANYVGVINHTLKTKGLLVDDERNFNNKSLSKDLLDIKSFVESSTNDKILPIVFRYDTDKR